jgi:CTP:molybdopterin cytidylyltransferase MocA
MSVAAVVLAAGEATRFGAPKQRLLLPIVLERLAAAPVDEIVVVEGAYELELVPSGADGPSLRLVHCRHWSRGPGASLRCGLEALDARVEVAIVVLADGPSLAPESVARVLDAWRAHGGIVAASYGGERGHPVAVGHEHWHAAPDDGLRSLPVRLVPCDDLGAPGDVDTQADLPLEP